MLFIYWDSKYAVKIDNISIFVELQLVIDVGSREFNISLLLVCREFKYTFIIENESIFAELQLVIDEYRVSQGISGFGVEQVLLNW